MAKNFKKLVVMGDSIVEGFGDSRAIGWAGRLAQKLNCENGDAIWTVSIQGFGGDTILDGKHRLASVLSCNTTHLVMAYGTNDMSRIMWPDDCGRKVSLAYAKQVWVQILETVSLLDIRVAVLGTLPVEESLFPFVFQPYDSEDRGYTFLNSDQQLYNKMLHGICGRAGIPFIDLFDEWMRRDISELLCDGLHPGDKGYDQLAEQVYSELRARKFFD